ncbi:hypothetical protein HD806DRAFT_69463 [Xylariaceae sp. AK1471]|nr:hypothetical protein HD806DRAFT_69463 [Xylariaceae sp. AK1471]
MVLSFQNGHGPEPGDALEKNTSNNLLNRFDKWVALSPKRCAIIFKNEEVSYEELQTRSFKLTSRLRSHGIGLESIVPFCLPKSVEAVVTILAILRCGAAFAAILPSAPLQRKKEIIEACRSQVLVCGAEEKGCAKELCSTLIFVGDETECEVSWETDENSQLCDSFAIMPNDRNAACVLFTSGSTGSELLIPYPTCRQHKHY